MKLLPTPRQICITKASPELVRSGLLAFVRAQFDAFAVDGITVRRTLRNKLAVSYPSRESRSGEQFALFLPIDPDWRREFEKAVLEAYERRVGG